MSNFANQAPALLLAADANSAATSFSLSGSTSNYPSVPFNVQITSATNPLAYELVRVTAKTATAFSVVTRGFGGTSALDWTVGAIATHVVTAEDLASLTLNVKMFGAPLDGASSDVAALQAAHDALPAAGGTILIPRATGCKLDSTVAFTKPVRLVIDNTPTTASAAIGFTATSDLTVEGNGGHDGSGATTITYTHASGTLFSLGTTSLKRFRLADLKLLASAATSAVCLSLAMSEEGSFERVTIKNFFGAVRLTGNGTNARSVRNHFRDILITTSLDTSGAYGIYADHSADTFIEPGTNIFMAPDGTNGYGIVLDRGIDGFYVDQTVAAYGKNGLLVRNTLSGYTTVYTGSPRNLNFGKFYADTTSGGDAVLFHSSLGSDVVRAEFTACSAAGAGLNSAGASVTAGSIGLNISGGSDIKWQGGYCRGNSYHGILVNSAGSQIEIIGAKVTDNNVENASDGDGVRLGASTSHTTLAFIRATGSLQKYGIRAGASEYRHIIGCNLVSNATGPLNNSGSGNFEVWGNFLSNNVHASLLQRYTTGSLPAAGALMDGSVIVEVVDATHSNLVIYDQSQRFRIAGGTAF